MYTVFSPSSFGKIVAPLHESSNVRQSERKTTELYEVSIAQHNGDHSDRTNTSSSVRDRASTTETLALTAERGDIWIDAIGDCRENVIPFAPHL